MRDRNYVKTLARLTAEDSLFWQVLLAISMLSLPAYVIVIACNVSFEWQLCELITILLCCTISIYIGFEIHQLIERVQHKDMPMQTTLQNLHDDAPVDAGLTDYDRYMDTIHSLNKNIYFDHNGNVKNIAYCRSNDFVDCDLSPEHS